MLNVALTGNIASGKSTVVRHFAEWGATVIDADELVHEAQQPGTETLAAIARRFGARLINPDGSLDRDALRGMVMGDDAALAELNAIVHPAVRRRRDELARQAASRGDLILVNDIPLLFEVLRPDDFDLVVLVDAPRALRRQRLMTERGLSERDANRMIGSQLPADRKRDRSDIVIDNGGTLQQLRDATWNAWRAIRTRAARAATSAHGPLLAILADPSDASFAIAGTIARYADAGMETHVVCADALRSDDEDAIAAVSAAIRRIQPQVMITFGPQGASGNADQIAVHDWVIRARAAAGVACPLYFLAFPADTAGRISPRLRGVSSDAIAAQIDVRPWRDVKEAALAACPAEGSPLGLDDVGAWPLLDHEWYTAPAAAQHTLGDLYAGGLAGS